MADPDTYNRIVLKLATPFTKYGETEHIWSLKFSLSGAEITDESDAEATANGLCEAVLALTTSDTSWVGWLYYAPGSEVNKYNGSFDPGVHPGTRSAYSADTYNSQQAEVIALLRCPVGVNSKGRTKYLFKHIHDVSGNAPGELAALTDPTALLANWNNGAGPDSLVPVDPTTGVQGGPWSIQNALYTRQLRRGTKAKA